MSIWVRLLQDRRIETNGQNTNYKKGDWVEIGKQTANLWITQGIADRPGYNHTKEYVDLTAGIVLVNGTNNILLNNIKQDIPGIEHSESDKHSMLYSENMIWSNCVNIKRENILVGFNLLKKWQVAIPMYSYDDLAIHQKMSNSEKKYLTDVVKDLRVPIYNTNLIFIRRCDDTRQLLEQWEKEKEFLKDDKLSFLSAYYKTKVTLCALPVNWII